MSCKPGYILVGAGAESGLQSACRLSLWRQGAWTVLLYPEGGAPFICTWSRRLSAADVQVTLQSLHALCRPLTAAP